MQRSVKLVKPTPVVRFLDNHYSHLPVEALELDGENGVHIRSILPYYSRRLQPLDVSVFGSVKALYKRSLTEG